MEGQRNVRLTIAYDGTPFVGWQRQAEGVSVQGLLEEALARMEGGPVVVIGAGRTDAGVHACGQVASCRLSSCSLETATLARALNAVLPPEVRILDVHDEALSFHARYSAHSKTYRYEIVNARFVSPFEWKYAWHIPERLDVDAMGRAACLLEGEHDFAAFMGSGSSVKTTTRTILASRVSSKEARILYEVTATGFLRHMVRTIVGTLVEVGRGWRDAASLTDVLHSAARSAAGPTAPAHGLFLVRVDY